MGSQGRGQIIGAGLMAVALIVAVLTVGDEADARSAGPAPKPYVRWSLVDRRAVTGADVVVDSGVRFIVPKDWTPRGGTVARYRFTTPRSVTGCEMTVVVFDRVTVGPAEPATVRLRSAMPARSAPYVLGEGTRAAAAWRVVRHRHGPIVGRYATRSAQLEKALGADAPAVWHEIDMVATEHGECHSGTIHNTADQIGDALASLDRSARLAP